MPTYVYRCRKCGYEFERLQRITEDPVSECPECKGEVSRIVFPVGIVFKGSGFHINDYPSSGAKGKSEDKPKKEPASTSVSKD